MKITDRCVQVDDEHELDKMLGAKERLVALFRATWCPFCASFLPVFEKHAGREGLSFLIVKDDQAIMGDRYSVEVVPTVLFFDKGKVAKRLNGVPGAGLNEKMLTAFIDACTAPAGRPTTK